jgi:predicted nucleic acid-binding Zn ribbon protein
MTGYKYECRSCGTVFIEDIQCQSGDEPEVLCSQCGGADLEESSLPVGLLDLLRGMMRPT